MSHKPFNVLDLFCGCGGLSTGFQHANFKILGGVDNENTFLETFAKNHPNAFVANIDLSKENFLNDLKKKIKDQVVDILLGGPPCQGFSLTGPRNFNDPRNALYLAMFKTVSFYTPKVFIIENVTGLKNMWGGQVLNEIIEKFEKELNYKVVWKILNSADYGVPQFRKRVFIVGVKNSIKNKFIFPNPTHDESNYVSCKDALSDLPSREFEIGNEVESYNLKAQSQYQKLMNNGCKEMFNHVATNHTEHVKNVIAQVPEGGNHKDLPPGVGASRKFNEAWTRYHGDKPSKTIDTGHRNHFHYKWNRVPTIRENARLQSFPDNFRFYGTKTKQNTQVGNAVPPLMAERVALEVKKVLNDN